MFLCSCNITSVITALNTPPPPPIGALDTPTPPPIGEKVDENDVKTVSMDKILMVETENVKDLSYEYNDQMKVSSQEIVFHGFSEI